MLRILLVGPVRPTSSTSDIINLRQTKGTRMIIGGGTIQYAPVDREATIEAILRMIAASQAEAGCVVYEISADLVDPNILHVFEVWESSEALEAHRSSSHMAVFDQEVAPSFVKMDLKVFVGEAVDLANP